MKKFTVFYHVTASSGNQYINAYHDAESVHGCFVSKTGNMSSGAAEGKSSNSSFEQDYLLEPHIMGLQAIPLTRCQANRLLKSWAIDFTFPQ